MVPGRVLIDFGRPWVRKLARSQRIPAFPAGPRDRGLQVFLSRANRTGLVFGIPRHIRQRDWAGYQTLAFDLENRGPRQVTVGVGIQNDPGAGKLDRKAEFSAVVPPGSRAVWRIPLQQLRYSRGAWDPWGWPRQRGLGDLRFMGLVDSRRVRQFRIFLMGTEPAAALVLRGLSLEDPIPPVKWVDRFGQRSGKSWPTKVRSEREIVEADRREERELEKVRPFPQRDEFQAWTGARPRKATGFFRVEKVDGRWWFVAPNGRLYYATGMDVVICGIDARVDDTVLAAYSWLPPQRGVFAQAWSKPGPREGFSLYRANLIRKWGPERYRDRYVVRAIRRQLAWGFTSVGNWSDPAFFSLRRLPYFSVGPETHAMAIPYAAKKIHDAFHPAFEKETLRVSEALAVFREDPWLVGHFVDNEIDWRGFPASVAALPESRPVKARLIERLRGKYRTIRALNRAWGIRARSFGRISWPGPGRLAAERDMSLLRAEFAERFYRAWARGVRKADPNHLVLGSRLHEGNRPPEVIRACARHMDVVSFNHYKNSAAAEEFGEYYRIAKKPFIMGEYGHNSLDAGLLTAAVPVADQRARAKGYRFYTEQMAAQPWFVGGHFFQYLDEPITGRFDRETGFNGFVNSADIPYPLMVNAAKASHARIYRVHAGRQRPFTEGPAL